MTGRGRRGAWYDRKMTGDYRRDGIYYRSNSDEGSAELTAAGP